MIKIEVKKELALEAILTALRVVNDTAVLTSKYVPELSSEEKTFRNNQPVGILMFLVESFYPEIQKPAIVLLQSKGILAYCNYVETAINNLKAEK